MKTQQELMQAYWGPGGTVDMVKEYNAKHGCDVRPWKCVRLGDNLIERHPSFDFPPDYYTFALTILYDDKRKEHRPVFVGDRLWKGQHWVVIESDLYVDNLSWHPPAPKRTFIVELSEEERNVLMHMTSTSYSKVLVGMYEKLTAARDKE